MADEFPHVEGVKHRFVDANGVRIHVAEAGPSGSAKPPVLLLHGWPQHWYMWRSVIEVLRGDFLLLAPDLRGSGWSDTPGHGYNPETFARDQVALLDVLGIERAFVIGHDWGGFTSFLLGCRHPERVERILALNTPHPWPRVRLTLLRETWRSWYAVAAATPGVGSFVMRRTSFAKGILSRGNVQPAFSEEDLDRYLERLREPARVRAVTLLYRSYLRAFAGAARGTWRSLRLTAPTLLLFGARDRYVTPKLLPGWEPHADDMRVELVPDSGHFIVEEKPDLVIERARELLADA